MDRAEPGVLDVNDDPERRGPGALANAATMSLIGPHGTSAASSRASQSALPSLASRSARIGRSSARVATRAPFVANRGSVARPASPEGIAEAGSHWRSLADRDRDLAVGRRERLVRDDVRVGVAAADRGDPVTKAFWAWLTRTASVGLEERHVDPLAAAGLLPAGSEPAPDPARRARRGPRPPRGAR